MSEKTTDQDNNSGEKEPNQPEDLFEATRKIADKAEGFANKTASKLRESEAFGKITDAFRKVSDYMDEKSEEFNKSDLAGKLETFKERAVSEADKYIGKAKEAGKGMSDEIDEAIESIREKMKKKE